MPLMGMRHRPPRWSRWDKGKMPQWRLHRRWFFWRFALSFLSMLLLMGGIIALLSRVFSPYLGGGRQLTAIVLLGGCLLFLLLPMLITGVSWAFMGRVVNPVAQVMAVTDAVAQGDLSARVETSAGGRFGRLSRSVNHMVSELERTYEQRRQMTADIAHELRTPLHIIQGNLEGIVDGVYEPTHEHIQNTLEETQLLSRLVEDLGTLSLAESGQLPLLIEEVNIAELLADVQTSFSGQADIAGIELRVVISDSTLPAVQGDVTRLDQVLGNLVANALRHTPAGGTILLSASPHADGVRIIVQDTGEGIAKEDLPYVFDRFWRGDQARAHTAGAGAGLGLAIAEQLVQAHGGAIEVESALGEGTSFTIWLPGNSPSR